MSKNYGQRVNDKRGVQKWIQCYATAIEVENNAFSFRYTLEGTKSKVKIDLFKNI